MAYIDVDKFAEKICDFQVIGEDCANKMIWLLRTFPTADVVDKENFAKEIFTKLYAHIKYDGHTVSVWKNDLISIAKQYGVDLDCGDRMDGGNK